MQRPGAKGLGAVMGGGTILDRWISQFFVAGFLRLRSNAGRLGFDVV